MQANQHEVFGDRKVLLDVIGVLLHGQPVGGECVFGGVSGRAAMRHQLLGGDRT